MMFIGKLATIQIIINLIQGDFGYYSGVKSLYNFQKYSFDVK